MDHQESRMIEGLFERLRQAENQGGPRDTQAEALIRDLIHRQPAAPYYMAQVILVQEHALQNLNARVQELEQELARRPAGGGFLAGLFGGDTRTSAQTQSRAHLQGPSALGAAPFPQGRGSFLGGALQTAAAVAGGVLLGNAIAGLLGDEATAADEPGEDEGFSDLGDDEF
jgi:hypothetical protein